MENITGKRSDPVRKIINIAQKTRQHCYTKLGKVTQIAIFKCLKNHVKIEIGIWNFAQRLEVSQIDSKKKFQLQGLSGSGFSGTPVLR